MSLFIVFTVTNTSKYIYISFLPSIFYSPFLYSTLFLLCIFYGLRSYLLLIPLFTLSSRFFLFSHFGLLFLIASSCRVSLHSHFTFECACSLLCKAVSVECYFSILSRVSILRFIMFTALHNCSSSGSLNSKNYSNLY